MALAQLRTDVSTQGTDVSTQGNDAVRMRRLVQAVQDLSGARDLEAVAAIVRSAARDLTGADGATFVLRDGDQCHYADEEAIGPLWKGKRFPLQTCISGWVMVNGKGVVIEDIYKDARIPHEAYRPTFVKSLAMVPIRPGNALGAIGNYWARTHVPNAQELEALQALANTTAVALESIQLYASLEARVQQRTQELTVANRELEAFTHTVSHDLRAPLRSVSAFAQLLGRRHGAELSDEARTLLDHIENSSLRLNHLCEALLEFSAVTRRPLVRAPLAMRQAVLDLVQETRRDHPGRAVQVTIAPDLPDCLADATLMRQVLQNLLANAFKFTKASPAPHIEVGSTASSKDTTYFVKDNGVGFDMKQAQALFSPFQTLHRRDEYPGSGIGLSIVQRIIERHGGRVWAESQPGRGATFSFCIPGEAQDPPARTKGRAQDSQLA